MIYESINFMVQSIWREKQVFVLNIKLIERQSYLRCSAVEPNPVVQILGPFSLSLTFLPYSIVYISKKCYNASAPFLPVWPCWLQTSATAHLVSTSLTCSLPWAAFSWSTHVSQVVTSLFRFMMHILLPYYLWWMITGAWWELREVLDALLNLLWWNTMLWF